MNTFFKQFYLLISAVLKDTWHHYIDTFLFWLPYQIFMTGIAWIFKGGVIWMVTLLFSPFIILGFCMTLYNIIDLIFGKGINKK